MSYINKQNEQGFRGQEMADFYNQNLNQQMSLQNSGVFYQTNPENGFKNNEINLQKRGLYDEIFKSQSNQNIHPINQIDQIGASMYGNEYVEPIEQESMSLNKLCSMLTVY